VWKTIRIAALLVLLAVVAAQAVFDRTSTTDWDNTLWVGIFPVAGDGRPVSEDYVRNLRPAEFASIETFFASEAERAGVEVQRPVRIELYPPPKAMPPVLERGASALSNAWWSLKMRWYARSAADVPGRAPAQIRVFVLYHDPAGRSSLPHSLGLQKGLIGVVNAFADAQMRGSNAVVIAHEVMHTLGATDKYDPATDAPLFPDGFAEPDRSPRYPQQFTEIMAGRRPVSETEQEMPSTLADVLVGDATAAEIGWPAP
jgi:hypothetical protein